jgi:Asp-tRNA(Asn)/Glu-tRNA(Gln) amidotransferase A subunit family amidase
MFAFECCNPVFGRTTNPYNAGYTAGGSSVRIICFSSIFEPNQPNHQGGEAAILAMNGAALGIGSDVGGSLRIPAAYCGIYSFKPGPSRVSYAGAGSKSARAL